MAAAATARVLHLCPDTRYLIDLFHLYRQALDEPPFESELVFLRGRPDATMAQRIGGRLTCLDLPRRALRGMRLAALWRLWRWCQRRPRFDLVVAHRFKPLALALALQRLGEVSQVFGVVHEIGQFQGRRRRLIERAAAAPLTLIGVSEAVRADLLRRLPGFPPQRVKALPNAVADPPLLARDDARARLRLAPQRFWFGSVGRLVAVKGHDVLLRAFAPLAGELPQAGLALVGAGPEEDSLRRLAHELDIAEQVAFCGWHTDAPTLLAAFDVCVFPSRQEGFGLAIAEAMAAARPVIATAVGGMPAVLGDQGLLVPADDTVALTRALRRLHDDAALREAMGAALRARWQANFSPGQFSGRLRQLAHEATGIRP